MSNFPPQLSSGRAIGWHTKQEDAILAMERSKATILAKWGNFHFTSFSDQDEFLDFISECKEEERQFFEVLMAGKPQLMFADLDGAGLSITRVELYEEWEILMKQVFNDTGLTFKPSNVRLLNSTGDKISGHWSYLGLSFKNSEEQKEFWLYVDFIIERDYPKLCFLRKRADEKLELMNVLDIAVYSKNRAMRTIYSHKGGSDRVLKPCKVKSGKILSLKQYNPIDYLIYAPVATEFYDLKIPKFEKLKHKYLTQDDIQKLILQYVPNVEISEVSGRMFKLRNVGTRVCIINGEENLTDNSYVIWRRDGLYFGCHDSGCNGHMKKICELAIEQSAKKYTIDDFRTMASECKTFKDRVKLESLIVDWMNKKYCLVKANKTFIVEEFIDVDEDDKLCKGTKYKDIKSFLTDFSNKILLTKLPPEETEGHKADVKCNVINTPNTWLCHPNRYEVDKIIFDPKMFYDNSPQSKNYYNLFTGFEISKDDVADIQVPDNFEEHPFFAHILKRWCSGDKQVYNVVLNVFAHILQKPWEKLQMSIILKSTMRTGKGIPLQIFKKIIGNQYFFQPSNSNQVLGNFNGQMRNCLVCFMDEMVWGGDKEKAGTIKKLATETVNYINDKFAPIIKVKNIANLFMASNEEWVVPAGATEQRWLVLNVDDELAICSKPLKNKIVKEILDIDIHQLAKFFYDRDLKGWSHRETINTAGLREQKIQSLSYIHRWWLNCLNKRIIPDDVDGICSMVNGNFGCFAEKDIIYKFAEKDIKDKHINETKFWLEMKRVIGDEYKIKRKMVDGTRKYFVNIPSVDVCRKRWGELYNDEDWQWDDDDCADECKES